MEVTMDETPMSKPWRIELGMFLKRTCSWASNSAMADSHASASNGVVMRRSSDCRASLGVVRLVPAECTCVFSLCARICRASGETVEGETVLLAAAVSSQVTLVFRKVEVTWFSGHINRGLAVSSGVGR